MTSDGYVTRWRALLRSVDADMKAGRGEIKPARVIEAKPDPRKVSLRRVFRVLRPFGRTL